MRRVVITIMLLLGAAGFAQAQTQTMGFAQAIKILESSCGKDIAAYCPNAPLANFGITKCLEQNAAKLSAQCNSDRAIVVQEIRARLAAQAAVEEVCRGDAARKCPSTKRGQGYTLQCLIKAEPTVSKRCNEAITAAGWR